MVNDSANSPNNVSVNLAGNLVDQCMPGNKITIIGIPRMTIGGTKYWTTKSPLYVDAISLLRDNHDVSSIRINEKAIERIRAEEDAFSLLVQSLCPDIAGHEIIKAGLILSLVGGNFVNKETRDSVHTLIIGNLGLGKSELLRACAQAAPGGVYIRGGSGIALEPSMINVRDTGTEDCRVEIGGLASANQGVCCIDELEKLSAQHQIISKVMERPAVRLINSELQSRAAARTSIVGIIDPIEKRYDVSKTVTENVNANHQLLSQFDMVFLMRDNPNMDRDKLICDRFLDNQTIRPRLVESASFNNRMETNSDANRVRNQREILANRSISEILPQELLQMYVSGARLSVQPEISRDSRALIELICLQRQRTDGDLMKFERLFRTLVLLVQARAKVDFRPETRIRDVHDAAEILAHAVSPDRKNRVLPSSNNSSKLTGNKINQFLSDLKNDVALLNKRTFTVQELRNIADKENITGTSLSTLISRLNDHGHLLKEPNNTYRVVID